MSNESQKPTKRYAVPPGAVAERLDIATKMKGIWRDEVYKIVNGEEAKVEDTGWKKNLIVVGMPKALAALMKNEPWKSVV